MKYTTYICAVLAGATMTVTSCKEDFLEERPYSNYSTGNISNSTIEAQLVGLHRNYADLWGQSGEQGFTSAWQIGMDITSAGATQGVENGFYQYATLNAENAAVSYLWSRCYRFINNANIIIAAAGDNNKPANAEARFFRAYAYNILVTLWGDVPLLTEPITVPTFNLTRQKVVDIDKVIDEDLTYAVANLPDAGKAPTESRINKDIARQLAAEAYLRMGMRDNSYFAKSEQMSTDIINNTRYKLIEARYGKFLGEGGDYYRDMFRFGNQRYSQGNTEAIWTFEMEYNRNVPNGTINSPQQRRVWQPGYHNWSEMVNADSLGGRGNGRLRLSNFMKYTVWKGLEGDIRNSNYNIRRTTNYNKPGVSTLIGIDKDGFRVAANSPLAVSTRTIKTGDKVIPFRADSLVTWYPYPTKWGGYDPTDDFGFAVVKDWPVMRLGETYLLRAEARFRQNNNAGAADDINKLRDRAFKQARITQGNPNLGKVSAADINIDFILDERARELIAEENRRMTLVRTGKLKDRIAKNGDTGPADKVTTGFQDYNVLLPIPLSEILLNNKGGQSSLIQNTGYGQN
ncbi:RagB/SusD family nutrient uptake outer membrane protein [Pedobacter sp. SYSU D00535]|uniref:RagB/SusD family nutrient uptake outer membrane protein n=1 Tax=Pedobacter sp. SYSU D00535 TaxID=2810308 RepID=UPI001A956F36|nr:RagB/SusD family nutrient uptake outer membrane protein [Pedobacter sp. SYSU D00535]